MFISARPMLLFSRSSTTVVYIMIGLQGYDVINGLVGWWVSGLVAGL